MFRILALLLAFIATPSFATTDDPSRMVPQVSVGRIVAWPSLDGGLPASPNWTQDGVPRSWRAARLDSREARVDLGGGGGVRGFLYHVPNPATAADQAYPGICPRCDEDRRRRKSNVPATSRTAKGVPHNARVPGSRRGFSSTNSP